MNDRVIRESTAALENFKYDFEEFVIGYSDRLKQIRKPFAVIEYQPPMRRFRRCGPSGSPPPGSPLFHPAPPTYIIRKYGWASVILFSLLLSAAALVALYAAVPAEAPASVWGFLQNSAFLGLAAAVLYMQAQDLDIRRYNVQRAKLLREFKAALPGKIQPPKDVEAAIRSACPEQPICADRGNFLTQYLGTFFAFAEYFEGAGEHYNDGLPAQEDLRRSIRQIRRGELIAPALMLLLTGLFALRMRQAVPADRVCAGVFFSVAVGVLCLSGVLVSLEPLCPEQLAALQNYMDEVLSCQSRMAETLHKLKLAYLTQPKEKRSNAFFIFNPYRSIRRVFR